MNVTRKYIFVRIDKAAQKRKREMINGLLYRNLNFAFMQCNLQYGEILQIGEKAQQYFPDARPGDYAVFHHTIEGEPGNNADEYIVDIEPNGDEIRWLDGTVDHHVYAIIKRDTNELIAGFNHVFFDTKIRRYSKRPESTSVITGETKEEDDDQMRERLERENEEVRRLTAAHDAMQDPVERADIARVLDGLVANCQRITKYLNTEKLASATIFAINPRTARELEVSEGDTVIVIQDYLDALEIFDQRFLRIHKDDLVGLVTLK